MWILGMKLRPPRFQGKPFTDGAVWPALPGFALISNSQIAGAENLELSLLQCILLLRPQHSLRSSLRFSQWDRMWLHGETVSHFLWGVVTHRFTFCAGCSRFLLPWPLCISPSLPAGRSGPTRPLHLSLPASPPESVIPALNTPGFHSI